MSSEKENLRLQRYILWAVRSSSGIPIRSAIIHNKLLYSGKWPDLSIEKTRMWTNRLVESGQLVVKMAGKVKFYRLPREGELQNNAASEL